MLIKRAPTPAFGGEGRGKKDCRNIAKFKSILSCATLIYKDDRLRNYTYSRVSIISYLFHLHLISISRHQALLTRYPLRFITIDSRGGKNRMLKDNRYRKKKEYPIILASERNIKLQARVENRLKIGYGNSIHA